MSLRNQIIRLAHENPELRGTLIPLLKEADMAKTPEAAKSLFERYKKKHPKTTKGPQDFLDKATSKSDKGDKSDKGEAAFEDIPEYKLSIIGDNKDDIKRAKDIAKKIKAGIEKSADICNMSPPVCEGNLGISRSSMPQLMDKSVADLLASKDEGDRKKGKAAVEAGADPKEKRAMVSVFLDDLKKEGITITRNAKEKVGNLKATQREIKAGKTYGMADAFLKGKYDLGKDPIIISSDNHILDGHHRWSALLTSDPDHNMNVIRVDMPMKKMLERSFKQKGVFRADIQGNIVSKDTPLNLGKKAMKNRNADSQLSEVEEAVLHLLFLKGGVSETQLEATMKRPGKWKRWLGDISYSPMEVAKAVKTLQRNKLITHDQLISRWDAWKDGKDFNGENDTYNLTTKGTKEAREIFGRRVPAMTQNLPLREASTKSSDMNLRNQLIRLAHANPKFRADLLPLIREAGCEKLPEALRENCEKKVEEGKKNDKKEARQDAIGQGKNGYIAFYKRKKVEVYADSKLEARDLAADHFRARRPYDVEVVLAEKGGQQVTHMPLFANDKKEAATVSKEVKVLEHMLEGLEQAIEDHEDRGQTPYVKKWIKKLTQMRKEIQDELASKKRDAKKASTTRVAYDAILKRQGLTKQAVRDGLGAMLYMIDAAKNNSKFYEMLIEDDGMGGYNLLRYWGALTDSPGTGRVSKKIVEGLSMDQAKKGLRKIYSAKTRKGYVDTYGPKHKTPDGKRLKQGEYPVGLTRSVGFGWGTQGAAWCKPALRDLQVKVEEAMSEIYDTGSVVAIKDDLQEAARMVQTILREDSSMGKKLAKKIHAAMGRLRGEGRHLPDPVGVKLHEELQSVRNYIRTQMSLCN